MLFRKNLLCGFKGIISLVMQTKGLFAPLCFYNMLLCVEGEVDVFQGFDGVAGGDVVLVEEAVAAVARRPDIFVR